MPSYSRLAEASNVLEYLSSPCNGRVFSIPRSYTVGASFYNVTWPNITTNQIPSNTFTDVAASVVNYQPPAGTTRVVYRLNWQSSADAGNATPTALWDAILHYSFFIDGVEVTNARFTTRYQTRRSQRDVFEWPIICNSALTVPSDGILFNWNSNKILKLQFRRYSGAYTGRLHETAEWDGGGTNMFSAPVLTLIALKDWGQYQGRYF